jgi:hypothetical protein
MALIYKLYNTGGSIVIEQAGTTRKSVYYASEVVLKNYTSDKFEIELGGVDTTFNLSEVGDETGTLYPSINDITALITTAQNAGGGGGGGDATAANQALQITEAQTTNTSLNGIDSSNNSIKGNTADTVQRLDYLNKANETGQTVNSFYIDTGVNYLEAEDVGKAYVVLAVQRTTGTESINVSSLVGLGISKDKYILYLGSGGTVTGTPLSFSNSIGSTGFSYALGADDNEITGFNKIFGSAGVKDGRLHEECKLNDPFTTDTIYLIAAPLDSDLEIYAGLNLKQIT